MNLDLLVQYGMQFVGLPYRWGGDDSIDGFDCSGFLQELLAAVGMDPPGDQTAFQLYEHLRDHGEKCQPKQGGIVFFGKIDPETKSIKSVSHVGFCIDGKHMLEAGGGDSKTITRADAAKQNAYIRIRPIARRNDFVGCYMPKYPSLDSHV